MLSKLSYKKWRNEHDYGKKWYSEKALSVVKRKSGDAPPTKLENALREVKLKFLFYNALLSYDTTNKLAIFKLIRKYRNKN